MHLSFDKFKEWALIGLLTGGVTILWDMNRNMAELNTKIAVIIRDQETSKAVNLDHEIRIRDLEYNKKPKK